MKVDLAQRKVVGSAAVPNPPVQLYLTPTSHRSSPPTKERKTTRATPLSVIDTKDMSTRGTVTTGAGPHGVVIDDSGDWAWVTNSYVTPSPPWTWPA